jgi:hypothetical protein
MLIVPWCKSSWSTLAAVTLGNIIRTGGEHQWFMSHIYEASKPAAISSLRALPWLLCSPFRLNYSVVSILPLYSLSQHHLYRLLAPLTFLVLNGLNRSSTKEVLSLKVEASGLCVVSRHLPAHLSPSFFRLWAKPARKPCSSYNFTRRLKVGTFIKDRKPPPPHHTASNKIEKQKVVAASRFAWRSCREAADGSRKTPKLLKINTHRAGTNEVDTAAWL